MSSLRLALKQSLAETGHLAIQEKSKRKHNHASSRHTKRKRKSNKQKQSSSKNTSRKKKYFMSHQKDSVGQFSAELGGRSMFSVSDSYPNPNTADADGMVNIDGESSPRSLSSDDDSSFSDSDTVTNSSSCGSHHRYRHRIQSSDDESSGHSPNDEDEMQEDMEGVFDVEGTSADESCDPNQKSNSSVQAHHRELHEDENLQPQEDKNLQPQEDKNLQPQEDETYKQPEPTRKKKKKKKDKNKRKKDRQKLIVASSSNSIGEEHESHGHVVNYEDGNEQSDGGSNMKSRMEMSQVATVQQNIGGEQHSHIARRPSLKNQASSFKMTVKEPSPSVLDWVSGMSQGKQRRKIQVGMRVKVCFEFKSSKRGADGKSIRYFRWCGGGVTHVGVEGKEIRILYDDGTSEDTAFPDREIVVDDVENGKHKVPADAFLPKQPATLLRINNANQHADSDDKILKSMHHNYNVGTESLENSINTAGTKVSLNGDHPPQSLENTVQQNISKAVKVECLEETNVGNLQQASNHNTVNNSAAKILYGSNSPKFSAKTGLIVETKTNDFLFNPSFEFNKAEDRISQGRQVEVGGSQGQGSHHNRGEGGQDAGFEGHGGQVCQGEVYGCESDHVRNVGWAGVGEGQPLRQTDGEGQVTVQNGAEGQDSSVRVCNKKLTLKCRKFPSSSKNSNNNSKTSGIDSISENKSANSASDKIIRTENSTPILKIRLKSKSKLKMRVDKAGSTNNNVQGEYGTTKIRIKSDPGDMNARESWSSFPDARNSNDDNTQKHGKSSAYTHSDTAWLGDDEGQGLKRSQSELEEASESENDTSTMLSKVSGKLNTDSRPDKLVHPNGAGNASHAPLVTDTRNTRRKHSVEKGNRRDISLKHNTQESASMTPVSEPSPDGMPKKKRPRSLNPVVHSQRSSGPRSPKHVKVGRVGQTGTADNIVGKKRKKDKQVPGEQNVTHDYNGSKLDNSKESSKHARIDGGDHTSPPRSRSANENGNLKHSQARSARKMQKLAKQKISGKDDSTIQHASNKGKKKSKSSKNVALNQGVKEVDKEENNWVQCENCFKWRCIPSYIDVKNLPEHWYCKDNPDKSRNTCEAPEQTQEEVTKFNLDKSRSLYDTLTDDVKGEAICKPVHGRNGVRVDDTNSDITVNGTIQYDSAVTNKSTSSDLFDGHTSEVQLTPDRLSGGEIDGTGSDVTVASTLPTNKNMKSNKKSRKSKGEEKEKKGSKGKKQKDPVNQEWVQCEKCEKWRRLPPRVKAKDLPDVWTCDMNDWDPRSASCAVAEDHKVDKAINPDKDIIGKDGLTSGIQKNKLSYRNLIRTPNRTISERTRATDSLFSSCATDPDKPPTVMYANSSAFQHKGSIYRPVEEEKSAISLFAYMKKSELWKDLYHYALQPTFSSTNERYKSGVTKTKIQADKDHLQSMKAMVCYALGIQTLPLHDILLECQCREWEDLQWADLRASCTLESIQLALNTLVKDGVVEASSTCSDYNETNSDMITYRKKQICRNDVGNKKRKAKQIKTKSRCMKISKPWKQYRSS